MAAMTWKWWPRPSRGHSNPEYHRPQKQKGDTPRAPPFSLSLVRIYQRGSLRRRVPPPPPP
jgi:hypothetical protein